MVDSTATQAVPLGLIPGSTSGTSRKSGDTLTADNVCFYDEDENFQYRERISSLDQALQKFTHGNSKRFIIFANKVAFDSLQDSADLNSFFPFAFWRIVKDDLNGAFGIERHGEVPDLIYDTWSTFKIKHVSQEGKEEKINYHWSQISVFIRQSKNKQFVLFIDCPPPVINRIVGNILLETERFPRHFARPYRDPFIWHALLIEELRAIYEKAGWKLRDVVRTWEKRRSNDPNVELLNEIGRHLIHGNEVLEVAGNTIDSLIHQHKLFYDENQAAEEVENKSYHIIYTTVQEKLFISKQDIKAINARAVTLYERLRHEINLAYHVAARNTTQLSIDIANIARRDNATMKALAFIGVLYLPGTFISGIFGSNFVNFSPSNGPDWQLSDKFWIYWAITIPVTVLTVLLWVVLDDTMEMYGSLIGRTRAAWRNIWKQFPIGKQPKNNTRREVNPC